MKRIRNASILVGPTMSWFDISYGVHRSMRIPYFSPYPESVAEIVDQAYRDGIEDQKGFNFKEENV